MNISIRNVLLIGALLLLVTLPVSSVRAAIDWDEDINYYTNHTFTLPPLFGPTIPILQEDDISLTYHYKVWGTGSYNADPEYIYDYLITAAEEYTTRQKTNMQYVSTSKVESWASWFYHSWCPIVYPYQFSTNRFYCAETTSGCDGIPWDVSWFADPIGGGPEYPSEIAPGTTDIVRGPDVTEVAGGTITTGYSSYFYTLNPIGQNAGGACGRVPTHFLGGSGSLYQIDLTLNHITNAVGSNVAAWPPGIWPVWPEVSQMHLSEKVSTPRRGFFCTNGSFHLFFSATSLALINSSSWEGPFYSVYASTNLQDWECIADWVAPSSNLEEVIDFAATNHACRFYVIKDDISLACSDAFGYIKKTMPAGYSLIANQLVSTNAESTTIASLLPNPPELTTLWLWGQTNWITTLTYSNGSWDSPSVTLIPGKGAMIHLASNYTATLIGEVLRGHTALEFPSFGYGLKSFPMPQSGSPETVLNSQFNVGDCVVKLQSGTNAVYRKGTNSWTPSTPIIEVGESFFVATTNQRVVTASFLALDGYVASGFTPEIAAESGTITIRWGFDYIGEVPTDAYYELRFNDGDTGAHSEFFQVTEDSLLLDWAVAVPSFQVGQGDSVKLRYVRRNMRGLWSNSLIFL